MRIFNPVFTVFLIFSLNVSAQQPGWLDPSFGNQGRVMEDFGGSSRAFDMAVLPDDRILIAGIFESLGTGQRALIARFLPDGDIDPDFGQFGRLILNIGGTITNLAAVEVLPDGRFYVAGKTHLDGKDRILVARFMPDGDFDTDFGTEGYTILSAEAESAQLPTGMMVDNAGRITVGGFAYLEDGRRPLLTRLDSDGNLDQGFGENGFVLPHVEHEDPLAEIRFDGIALQDDGKIVAAGYYGIPLDFKGMVMRFEADGSPDPDFGDNGVMTLAQNYEMHHIYDVVTTVEGNILISGNYFDINVGPAYLIMRILPDGSIDQSFGNGGYSTPEVMISGSFGRFVVPPLTAGGPVISVGHTGSDFSAIRVTHQGVLDPDFGTAGIVITPAGQGNGRILAAGRQSDGKLVTAGMRFYAGYNEAALLRYSMESTLSTDDFAASAQIHVYPNPSRGHVSIILPKGAETLTLYNTGGQPVMQQGLNGNISIETDLSHLSRGIYHLVVTDRSGAVYRNKIAVL